MIINGKENLKKHKKEIHCLRIFVIIRRIEEILM